ncbi:NAD(P)/FAD-dependent oxidoreductase [Limibaculum sp. M0105]|uniref:Pyridine nucleotide-disulfide oxidoreductase domain-containing protein 2 n=1 Tax=Thermohalobaculum xanthum TaxID=2753746 RepID=A0A8J7M617_9RHOB|nr:NAD(P)/FAD-dependent oxidoreductase [Thermohalobaculum xanthum]MBK0399191.1 NAD(P)/FAD-dependent oxidoreductase [Thermohalobaculum xanthum]
MSRSDHFDAIVAGGGHNGLTAACYMARAGMRVLVVEKNDWLGGAAVSRELHAGWTYSNCSYVCSLLRPEVVRDLDLPQHGLQVIPYTGGATFTRDGDYFAYHSDHRALEREIARLSPRDVEGYERFSIAVMRQCRFIRPLLLRTPPDPVAPRPRDVAELVYLLRRFHDLGPRETGEAMRFWTASVGDYLDGFIENPLIKAHLAGSGIIGTGLGVYSPGTAYVLLHHYMGDVDGAVGAWGFARGGMGAVSGALARAFRAAGGEVVTCSGVERILVENGRVTGVALANGDTYRAPVVASGMDVKRTFLGHVEAQHLPDDFLKAVRRFKIRGSSGKINIALDAMPRFPAAPEDASFLSGDLHVSESLAELERAYDDWSVGRWSAEPYVDMLIPSRIDPTMAPPGKHMMTVFVQYAPYDPERDGRRDPAHWDEAARTAFADAVLDRIERVSPGFRDLVLHAEVRTPVDLEREVGLTEGNIFQGELTFDQLLFNRPVPGYADYRTPVKGLYLVGSSAHPGGGVMAAPGANAAREILRDARRLDRTERAFRAA